METTVVYWGYLGIMEKKMETTVVYWGYVCIGLMKSRDDRTLLRDQGLVVLLHGAHLDPGRDQILGSHTGLDRFPCGSLGGFPYVGMPVC